MLDFDRVLVAEADGEGGGREEGTDRQSPILIKLSFGITESFDWCAPTWLGPQASSCSRLLPSLIGRPNVHKCSLSDILRTPREDCRDQFSRQRDLVTSAEINPGSEKNDGGRPGSSWL